MQEGFSIKKLLLTLPVIYIMVGWGIGLLFATQPVIFGPYQDVPVIIKTSFFDTLLDKPVAFVVPLEKLKDRDPDAIYVYITGHFEVPGRWVFKSRLGRDFDPEDKAMLTGSMSRAIMYEEKNPDKSLGHYSIDELSSFINKYGKPFDSLQIIPFVIISNFEKTFPYLYSGSVLLPNSMGRIFNDKIIPYDMLGLVGLVIVIIAFCLRSFKLWAYYLYWVFAYWFGRIGYHDPNLMSSEYGQRVILWSFWNGFICKEGRVFLALALGLSVILFGVLWYIYLTKHIIPRKKRQMEDFLKIDREAPKRKELSIDTVEFKDTHYDINKRIAQYAKTDKYFLGVSDQKQDITIDEYLLTHHLHILGPTGSGKTSLAILPLAKQTIDKGRGCCFIDFKGDEVFKRYVQKSAKEKGKKFYYFSIDPNEPSVGYNPLSSGDIHSKVDRIMTALELVYKGPASFYSNVQAMAFIELLKEMVHNQKELNFSSVRDSLENPHFLRRIYVEAQEVKGLLAAISWISELKVINRSDLNLSKIIKDGDIAFFALKSQVNARLAEAVGKMLIIDLKYQAVSRKETDIPYFIFIDEFQNLASPHFVDVISKVRSASFSLILSNQSRGNLSRISPAFENAIFTNTATKIIFAQEDPIDAQFWADKTGKTTYQDKSVFVDDRNTMLDGIRTAGGNISTATKNYIAKNVFLNLPFSKSIIFIREKLAVIASHEFLFDKEERDRIISIPFEYDPKGK